MNWNEVRRHNRKASARKAKRERYEAERKARVEHAGGPFSVGELRAAVREMRRCRDVAYQRDFDVEVWVMRGKEWATSVCLDGETVVVVPHTPNSERADERNAVPMTAGAQKWVKAEWAKQVAG